MTDMATGSDVTKCHVTPKGFLGSEHACATGNCAISALVGPFHRKWLIKYHPYDFPGNWSHVTGRALVVLSRTSTSYNHIIFYELSLSRHFICISFYNSTYFSSTFSISFHYSTYFLPYSPYHFTIQLAFLPYFPYLFTIKLTFPPYFPNLFTIQLTFLP